MNVDSELVLRKNYFKLEKIFILRLFKTSANQTDLSRFEKMSVINFRVAEKCKPCEIYRMMYDVYRKACFGKKKLQMGKTWVCHN